MLLSSPAVIGEFYARLEQAEGGSWVPLVANYFASNQEAETYPWLGQSPAMREWTGGRQANRLREESLQIRNKKYEATLEVSVDDIRRDKSGQVQVRIAEMAQRTHAHWARLLSTLLLSGETGLCYDGQFFFDTDHSEGASGTQSNAVTYNVTTPAAPTAAEFEYAVMEAVQKIIGFVDDTGEPANENASRFLVMVPVSFMGAAAAALKNPVIIDGSGARTNTLVNIGGFQFELAVNPRLSWTDKFVTFRTDGTTNALIQQEEVPVEMSAIAEGSELEFTHDKHQYGVKAVRAVGFGHWQRAVLTTLT